MAGGGGSPGLGVAVAGVLDLLVPAGRGADGGGAGPDGGGAGQGLAASLGRRRVAVGRESGSAASRVWNENWVGKTVCARAAIEIYSKSK